MENNLLSTSSRPEQCLAVVCDMRQSCGFDVVHARACVCTSTVIQLSEHCVWGVMGCLLWDTWGCGPVTSCSHHAETSSFGGNSSWLVCSLLSFGGGLHFHSVQEEWDMQRGGCQTIYHFNKAEVVLGPWVGFLSELPSPGAKITLSKWL